MQSREGARKLKSFHESSATSPFAFWWIFDTHCPRRVNLVSQRSIIIHTVSHTVIEPNRRCGDNRHIDTGHRSLIGGNVLLSQPSVNDRLTSARVNCIWRNAVDGNSFQRKIWIMHVQRSSGNIWTFIIEISRASVVLTYVRTSIHERLQSNLFTYVVQGGPKVSSHLFSFFNKTSKYKKNLILLIL